MHTPDRDAGPLEGAAAGSWSLGTVERSCSLWSRARAAVDCRETDGGDVRAEIVVGNACVGKPGSHGSKAILLSQRSGVEPSPQPLSHNRPAAEQQRGWPIKPEALN